jgi:hypothetical protein
MFLIFTFVFVTRLKKDEIKGVFAKSLLGNLEKLGFFALVYLCSSLLYGYLNSHFRDLLLYPEGYNLILSLTLGNLVQLN